MLAAAFFSGPTLTGLGTLIFACAAFVTAWSGRKAAHQTRVTVNGRSDRMQRRIEELTEIMGQHGISVPEQEPEPEQ